MTSLQSVKFITPPRVPPGAALKQALRFAVSEQEIAATTEVDAKANLMLAFVVGRWHQYAKSGFDRDPMQHWPAQWRQLIQP